VTCLVCDQNHWIHEYQVGPHGVKICRGCQFAMLDPMPSRESRQEFYRGVNIDARDTSKKDSLGRQISIRWKQFIHPIAKQNKKDIFYRKLVRHVPEGAKILDVGCGKGSFLERATQRFACSGIEISEALADVARGRVNGEIFVGDFLMTDFGDRKYDGITLISILEHWDDPLGALKKVYHLMTDQGVMLLKTVNFQCWNRVIMGKKWTGLRPPDHMVYFDPRNLKQLLHKVGFSKVVSHAWGLNDNMYCEAWK
jgi:2-polyprenyl-3-methyl-5-hydroxy-6-metoxy-1,4-benzoquinol methylase